MSNEKKKLYYNQVIDLYCKGGKNATEISKEIPVNVLTIQHWIRDFVIENPCFARKTKRELHLDEAMRLYQNNVTRRELAERYSVSRTTIDDWIHDYVVAHPEYQRRSLKDMYYDKALMLHNEKGLGPMKISKLIPVSPTTISLWFRTFAEGDTGTKPAETGPTSTMPDDIKATDMKEAKPTDTDVESLRKEIEKLKKQLSRETLRADAYNEMINIAEKKFNIAIRKKSGAKQ